MGKTQVIGNTGEEFVAEYLKKKGYIISAKNYRTKFGEIDIIAKIKNKIVFVEVKTRKTNSFGTPLEAITKTKYNNIKTGVLTYLQENKIKSYQIDVIGITLEPELKIEHLRNV